MSSLIKYAADAITTNPNSEIVERDKVLTFFRELQGRRARLEQLKIETRNHVWYREQDGKIETVPLATFGKIQARMGRLDAMLQVAEEIAIELDALYQKHDLDGDAYRFYTDRKHTELSSMVFELRKEIARGKASPTRVAEATEHIASLQKRLAEIESFRETVLQILQRVPWR